MKYRLPGCKNIWTSTESPGGMGPELGRTRKFSGDVVLI